MSYKVCIKQFIPSNEKQTTSVNEQRTSKKRRNVKKMEQGVTQEEVLKSHINKLIKKGQCSDGLLQKHHNRSLQCLNQSNSSSRNSDRRREGSAVWIDSQPAAKLLFKDIFMHNNCSAPKGSYLTSPRASFPKKETLTNYFNMNLDKIFYYRKLLSPPKTILRHETTGQTERTEKRKLCLEDIIPKKRENNISATSVASAERNEYWGSTLNRLRDKLNRRTKNKYTCQLNINRIKTEGRTSIRPFQKIQKKEYSSKLSAIVETQMTEMFDPNKTKRNIFLEELNPWSTSSIKLAQEQEPFSPADHS